MASSNTDQNGHLWEIAPDVAALPQPIVNVVFIGSPNAGDRGWLLVDAGLPGMTNSIVTAAATRFGLDARPAAIVLTHAHFDHVGALETLTSRWDVPVFVPRLEMPYVTGEASYPPPDPNVGGGAMSWLSPLYPRGPVNVAGRALPLDDGAGVPLLGDWAVIDTPGHSPGHVSLFRAADGLLIAGDTFVTTDQESTTASLMKPIHVQGPPMYFTHDWQAARRSVSMLRALQPRIAITGHGRPLSGAQLSDSLAHLEQNFEQIAIPRNGRYVDRPVTFGEHGPVSVPDATRLPLPTIVMGAAVAGVLVFAATRGGQRHSKWWDIQT